MFLLVSQLTQAEVYGAWVVKAGKFIRVLYGIPTYLHLWNTYNFQT